MGPAASGEERARFTWCRQALLILMVLTSYVNYGLKTTSFVDSYKFKNQHPGRCHKWLSTKWVHRPECWFDGYARINKWRHSKLEKQQMVRRDIWTTSTNLPINKMGQPHILLFLAPYHFSCCPENTKWGAPTVSSATPFKDSLSLWIWIDHLLVAIKFITTKRGFSEDFFRGPFWYFKMSYILSRSDIL